MADGVSYTAGTAPGGLAPRPGEAAGAATAFGLELRLFGPVEVRVGGRPLPRLRSRKGMWLLALLALRAGRDVDRDWLAGTLWPDHREEAARRSLRQSLHDLRAALGSQAERLACESPRTLHLDLSSGAWMDVRAFDAATLPGASRSGRDPGALAAAVALYRGPLLEDCSEEWVLDARRQREQQYVAALEALAATAAACREHTAAADYLRRALVVEPLREDLLRAWMEALAADGSVAAALVAFREFRARLWREAAVEPDAETAALYRRLRDGARRAAEDTGARPAPATSATPALLQGEPSPLPQPRTALIGREDDADKVAGCLGRSRLVTLTGTGGVGKTRLALRVAERAADDFEGGARFADLSPVADGADVPEAVRQALGLPAPPKEAGRVPPVEFLCRSLAPRRLLLVLDNCEHVLGACASLADALLAACPELRLLTTSRQSLGLRGEAVWRVPSLGVPPESAAESELADFAAVRLFLARAADADAAFRLGPGGLAAVARVCRRLDGIPLAIELAAARVRVLTVQEIDSRLGDQFRLLTGGDRAALPRQQTLRGALDWSHDLLSGAERALLARLSVFSGGWTLEAAEAVCAGPGVEPWEVLDLLAALVDKSLVHAEARPDGTTRYRLLETVRQYARDRLAERGAGEAAAARAKHQAYFAGLLAGLMVDGQMRPGTSLDPLKAERDNLLYALEWRGEGGAGDEETREVALRALDLAGNLVSLWTNEARPAEAEARLRAALSFAGEVFVGNETSDYVRARAKAKRELAAVLREQGEYPAARALYEVVLEEYARLGDRKNVATAHREMGMLERLQSRFDHARELLEQALGLYRELDDRHNVALTLVALGIVAGEQADLGRSTELFEEALPVLRAVLDRRVTAIVLNNLSINARERQDYARARELLSEALAIHRENGDQRSIAITLLNLGGCDSDLGNYGAARRPIEEALEMFRQAGIKIGVANALVALGIVLREQAELARAWGVLQEAVALFRGLGDRLNVVFALLVMAEVEAAQGRWEQALRLVGVTEALRAALGGTPQPSERLTREGLVHRGRAAVGEAEADELRAEGRAMDPDLVCDRLLRDESTVAAGAASG